MLTTSKTINISGYSQVNENSKPYVYFSASIEKLVLQMLTILFRIKKSSMQIRIFSRLIEKHLRMR